MSDVLLATATLCLLVAVACLLVMLLLVVPFVLTVDQAERRGAATFRWGAAALLGDLLMLALASWALMHDKLGLLPALLLLPWIGLAAVSRDSGLRGRAGAHQP